MEYFAIKLLEKMKEKGITQKKLYQELNIGKNQIHYWVKNKAEPDLETLKRLAIYLETTSDYLIGLENEDGIKANLSE
ncbi:MAG: helix-turn-helix transcriptional regulator [Clostridiales bacterium]|jgi:transcriptional regulator with XRE-family HTH domain|nr:helix-turn-helix transcriptional regulator [Clostridiales bacterium]